MRTDWKRFLTSCFVPLLGLIVGIQDYALAQSGDAALRSLISIPIIGSFEPVTTLEKFCGSLLPKCGIGNTFRSEVGTGYGFANTFSAKLTRGSGDFDLLSYSKLDQGPPYIDIRADLRLRRFGFRGSYYYFDNKSHDNTLAKLQWNGLRLGLDLDAVQHEWLTFGASLDGYLVNPRLSGRFFTSTTTITVENPDGTSVPVGILTDPDSIHLPGEKPWTWGIYLRYMPPAILGMPVHFDAYYNLPLAGSKYTSYGATLVFRPQIHRFNLACKLGFDWSHLKFANWTSTLLFTDPANWELDMEWKMFKVDFAAYF